MKMRVYTCKEVHVHVPVEARSAWFLLRQGLSYFAGSLLRLGSLKKEPQGPQTTPSPALGQKCAPPQFVFSLFLRQGLCM